MEGLKKRIGVSEEFACWIEKIHQTPYGRISNQENLDLILVENKGTCSTKHAFLKKKATELHEPNVKLLLGVFRMNGENTKPIKSILKQHRLSFIPEAHCYLKINDKKYDFTFPKSDEFLLDKDLLMEQEIEANQIGMPKITLHKNFLKNWIQKSKLSYTLDEIWKIRERCIQKLSQ